MPPVLELRGVTKTFPGVLANDQIDFSLNEGEIMALLGENGAGKTTLMNILYGLYTPDEGEIFIRGSKVDIHDPGDAIKHGIGMVHQHFMLVPVFTVTENVMLGVEPTKYGVGGFLDREAAANRIREISSRFGLHVDPNALVEDLPVGVQQRVEIIKVLYREADILILDEPTAVLTPQEVTELFKVVRSLVEQGKSVVFITHKLKEVLAIADGITVLRDGKVVGVTKPAEATEGTLAKMMVGREVILRIDKKPAEPMEVVLKVEDLYVKDDRDLLAVDGVSFQLKAGEVLGIAGVQGNGQTEMVEALTGLRQVESGRITIHPEADDAKILSWPGHVVNAGLLNRIAAALIDTLILGVAAGLVYVIFNMIARFTGIIGFVQSYYRLFNIGLASAAPICLWLYYALMESSSFQGTLGKRALNITVTDIEGNPIDFRKASVRYWAKFLSAIPLFIGFLVAGFSKERQALHDILADCLVIKEASATPRDIIETGTAHVPEDRQQDGLVLTFSVADNLVLSTYYVPPFARGLTLQQEAIEIAANERVEQFDVRTTGIYVPVSNLSGGNQQKVIVAREFSRPIDLLIASQPTRGLDVGSIEYIHSRIIQKRDEGCGVLLVSPELDEIINLADRIAVMFEGKILSVMPAAEATKEKLGLLMAGIQEGALEETNV